MSERVEEKSRTVSERVASEKEWPVRKRVSQSIHLIAKERKKT